ncbi:MAG: hypothetical protein QM578_12560 [Pantoea sp.]|uniref:hypothetical protein n=1 Tax=Pantoea sp. TaxID=69393 RepID=UPI0039E719A1
MTSNDELERQKFRQWFSDEWENTMALLNLKAIERRRFKQMAWNAWLARSKQEAQ